MANKKTAKKMYPDKMRRTEALAYLKEVHGKTVHPNTLNRWRVQGRLNADQVAPRLVLFYRDSLDEAAPSIGEHAVDARSLDDYGRDKHIRAAELYENGRTFVQIAKTLGYAGESGARKAVLYGQRKRDKQVA